jgi:hypothetical protein
LRVFQLAAAQSVLYLIHSEIQWERGRYQLIKVAPWKETVV